MPGYAYGLPAWECKTGAKLAKVPGSCVRRLLRYERATIQDFQKLNALNIEETGSDQAPALG